MNPSGGRQLKFHARRHPAFINAALSHPGSLEEGNRTDALAVRLYDRGVLAASQPPDVLFTVPTSGFYYLV